MVKSQYTSLHTLILDSVSMLAKNGSGNRDGLSTTQDELRCEYAEEHFMYEKLSNSASWTDTLEKITPGTTLEEKKYAHGVYYGVINKALNRPPAKEFRGYVKKIVLKSCGYVRISGVQPDDFNQNSLVLQDEGNGIDFGLMSRKQLFEYFIIPTDLADRSGITGANGHCYGYSNAMLGGKLQEAGWAIMMPMTDPNDGKEWFGLGTLTQCIHPIEKRVLEQGFGFSFGWGDNVERYFAVDDGFLQSGTGRFSGVLTAE
jgi:hypothetical protein